MFDVTSFTPDIILEMNKVSSLEGNFFLLFTFYMTLYNVSFFIIHVMSVVVVFVLNCAVHDEDYPPCLCLV